MQLLEVKMTEEDSKQKVAEMESQGYKLIGTKVLSSGAIVGTFQQGGKVVLKE